jgi:hypothetical protein
MWTEAGTFSLRDRRRSLKHHNSFSQSYRASWY